MKTLLIIPAFNEETTIAPIVRRARTYIADILVIDDGSADGTYRAALAAGAMVKRLQKNQGKGEALKVGFRYGLEHSYDRMVTIDGDGQHDPRDLEHFLPEIAHYDLLLGNRMHSPAGMPLVRRLANLTSSLIVSFLCGRRIYDSQTGFRSYSGRLLKEVHLSSRRFALETEVVIKAARRGMRIGHHRIETIYAGEESRYRPVVDSVRFLLVAAKSILKR